MRSVGKLLDSAIWYDFIRTLDKAFAYGEEDVGREDISEVDLNIFFILDGRGDDPNKGVDVWVGVNVKRGRYLIRRRLLRMSLRHQHPELTYHIFLRADPGGIVSGRIVAGPKIIKLTSKRRKYSPMLEC